MNESTRSLRSLRSMSLPLQYAMDGAKTPEPVHNETDRDEVKHEHTDKVADEDDSHACPHDIVNLHDGTIATPMH
jgi:hypothetical protein